MRISPIWSTMNSRPDPSPAWVTDTGEVKPSATVSSTMVMSPGMTWETDGGAAANNTASATTAGLSFVSMEVDRIS